MFWNDKPYYSLNYYYKEKFNTKVYKLALNGGMTCPNRDGLIDTRGCIFCSAGGSGEFTPSRLLPVSEQLKEAKKLVARKNPDGKYIAYFQAYTNTYAPVAYLRRIYYEALSDPDVVGISIATRPDCISDEVYELLSEMCQKTAVYVELGLQTIHEDTAAFIRRGYSLDVFDSAVARLKAVGVNVVAHMIIGLPGEDKSMILDTAAHLAKCRVDGVKLQLLHILKNTDLALVYEKEHFHILSLEEYCDIIVSVIENLPPDIVIHRLTGDGKRDMLIEPLWSLDKKNVLNTILKTFRARETYQGKMLTERRASWILPPYTNL